MQDVGRRYNICVTSNVQVDTTCRMQPTSVFEGVEKYNHLKRQWCDFYNESTKQYQLLYLWPVTLEFVEIEYVEAMNNSRNLQTSGNKSLQHPA